MTVHLRRRRGSGLLLVALSLLFGPTVVVVVVGQTCQLCPSGSTMQSANKSIPTNLFQMPELVNIGTCGDIDNQLSLIPTTTLCDAFLQPFLTAFDAQYYCGCTGVGAPNVCPFCGVLDPNAYLPSQLGLSAITCGDIATYVTSLLNASRCDSSTNVQFGQFCCNAQSSSSAPGFSTSSSAPATVPPGLSTTTAPPSPLRGGSLPPGMTPAPFTAVPGGTVTSMPVTTAVPIGNGNSSSSAPPATVPPASNYTGTQLPVNLPGTTSLFPSTVPPGTGLPGGTQLPIVPGSLMTSPPTTMVPAVIPPGMTPSPVTTIPVATGGLSQAPTILSSSLPGGVNSNSSTGSHGGGNGNGMNETSATRVPNNNSTTTTSRAPSPTFATVTTPAPIGKLSVRTNVTTSGGGNAVVVSRGVGTLFAVITLSWWGSSLIM